MANPSPQVDPNNPQPTPGNPNPGPARTPTPADVPQPAVPPGVPPSQPDVVPANPEPVGVPPAVPQEVPTRSAARGSQREHYCLFDTAIGTCGIAWSARGLTRLQLPEADRSRTERRLRANGSRTAAAPPAAIRQTIADIRHYLAGERVDFSSVPLDLMRAEPFERDVYAAARAIGWGHTTSYGDLARQIGAPPQGARDVGQALGRNPIPIIVPCHRILAKGRAVGGFSAHGGTRTKRRLLELEGVRLDDDALRLPGL